jgi:hypothetical protein
MTVRETLDLPNRMGVDRDSSPPGLSGEPGWQHRRVPVTNYRLGFTDASGFTT